jgi:DNA-binding transcriptional ArsR family regulator
VPEGPQSSLPAELAEKLSPILERALGHPTRRRILRALDGTGEAWTLEELGAAIAGTPISTVSYHVLVLEECGSVLVTVALPESQRSQRFASAVGDDATIREVLDRTRAEDEQQG